MEKNNNSGMDQWVSERLDSLAPRKEFQPNTTSALARFRTLRTSGIRSAPLGAWAAGVAFSVALLCFFALPGPRSVAQRCVNFCFEVFAQSVPTTDHPDYAGARLKRPDNYREWVYLSSGLGMEYNAAAGASENFTNVFVPQWAYREFLASGKWPDRVMFVLENRASQTKGSINKTGHFQTDLVGLAVEVKDATRFANQWAYFSFGGNAQTAEAMSGPSDACWRCHNDNAAVEHTFVQFYPTLKPIAMKFGTYHVRAE